MHGLQIDDMNISEFSDTIDNERSDALYSGNYSKKTLAIPCLTFGLGVIGNCLAIAALLRYKYRKQRPPTDTPTTIHKTPPPNLRKNRSTGNISTRDCRKSCSLGSKFDFNILKPIKRRGRRNDFGAFHTLVLALIVVDLAGILVTSPVTMYLYSTNQGIKEAGGESLCNYSAFAMMFFGIVTMASLTGMAIERVLSIQYPYFYKRAVKPKLANIAILIVLLASALFSALPSMGFGAVRSMYPNTWCFADWQATEQKDMAFNYIYATIGIALILTTILCNVSVVVGLLKMKKIRAQKKSWGMETQTIIQLIVMTCIYIICWLPLMVRIIVNQHSRETNGEHDRLAIWLAAANPILDPWVYILLRRTVVKRIINFAKSTICYHRKKDNKSPDLDIVVTPAKGNFMPDSTESEC